MALGHALNQMIQITNASRGNYGNGYGIGDGAGQAQIKTDLGAIPVHGGEQYFSGAVFSHAPGPANGFDPGFLAPAMCEQFIAITNAFGVDGNDDALAAELQGRFAHKLRMADGGGSDVLERLFAVIESRKGADASSSYTAKLFAAGNTKICQKVGEEAIETITAALAEGNGKTVNESADLLYHLLVLWADMGIDPAEVWAELMDREGVSGIDEKNMRTK